MSFHRETAVKRTRRARKCDWCWFRIEKGDPSVSTSGVYDGGFYTGRYHPGCHAAIRLYYETHNCWGDEMPEERMERGGIRFVADIPEEEITPPTSSTPAHTEDASPPHTD